MELASSSPAASSFWDPIGEPVTRDSFSAERAKCQKRLAWYRAHPHFVRRMIAVFCGVVMMNIAAILVISYRYKELHLELILFSAMPAAFYVWWLISLQTDLLKMLIAEKRGWIYSPKARGERIKALKQRLPIIFTVGHSQLIEDEFWGQAESKAQRYDFWLGKFQYTVGSGKHSHTYRRDVVAVHLPRAVPHDFCVCPEGTPAWLGGLLDRSDIETESTMFNQAFSINYKGDKTVVTPDILKILSPAVQTGLLELKKKWRDYTLYFMGNALVLSCRDLMPMAHHTNFAKAPELDPRDEEQISASIATLLGVVDEVVRYIG